MYVQTHSVHKPCSLGLTNTPHAQPTVMYEKGHPVYPVLQKMGREITKKVKPKAVVVFSAHWQAKPDLIQFNNAVDTDLIYECVVPTRGHPITCHELTADKQLLWLP